MGTYVIRSQTGLYFAIGWPEAPPYGAKVSWTKEQKLARRFASLEDIDAAIMLHFRVTRKEAKELGLRALRLVPNKRKAAREALLAAANRYAQHSNSPEGYRETLHVAAITYWMANGSSRD